MLVSKVVSKVATVSKVSNISTVSKLLIVLRIRAIHGPKIS